jgi:hypothetical protein
VILLCTILETACAFEYVTGKAFFPYEVPTRPAKGKCITDAQFNTSFCRVTDVQADGVKAKMAAPVYSRWTPLNSDGKYLYLQRAVGNPDALIYSAQDYSLVKILPSRITIDGVPNQLFISMEGAEIRWDYTGEHPNRFYFVNGTRFFQYNLVNDTAHVIHDFKNEFPEAAKVHNDVEGDSSADSRYWSFMVRSPYDHKKGYYPLLAIVTYDKKTDTILGTMDLDRYRQYGGKYDRLQIPNMVEISPSGKKVIYHIGACWPGSAFRKEDRGTYFDGPHAWDLDWTNPVKVGIDETHSGWGWGYDGSELFVSQNNSTDWIEAVNVHTGEKAQILYHGDLGWKNGFHFARMPSLAKGWILMSTYTKGNKDWGDNQLIMLELKDRSDNPRIWRLGHTHNEYKSYYSEGFATISQFGDKIWWAARWPGQDHIETYEMTLPKEWWKELSEQKR